MNYKNFPFENASGIVMPVFSLPNKYGIGTFGKCSFEFIDFLKATGQKCWQVLPLNPTSYGDSPYQSPSSFAGNPYFIDLDVLVQKGLLTKADIKGLESEGNEIDYSKLFSERFGILRKAYKNFTANEEYVGFIKENKKWLDDYALFMALKVKNNYLAWYEWEESEKFYKTAKLKAKGLKEDINFFKFLQFEFFSEWQSVLNYAHLNGVSILGDLPIYVAYDSVDVWSNTAEYLLDDNLTPTVVAGVPPDNYSDIGQLWGNPIYNYAVMKENGYKWWIERFKNTSKLYDIVRIDHFRAFAGYYVIPYGEETAINGHWEEGVGKEFFDLLFKKVKGVKIIAEDLGFITKDVFELIKYTGFPGMKVLQFAFYDDNSIYLPANFSDGNTVVYTATHDSETTFEWLAKIDEMTYNRFKKVAPKSKRLSDVYKMIAIALSSKANLALITLQDYLELGKESRLNVPSTPMGNWTWRVNKDYNCKKNIKKIFKINKENLRINEE